MVCFADINQTARDFAVREKMKPKTSDHEVHCQELQGVLGIGEMSNGWYSTDRAALNMFKFVYRFERTRDLNWKGVFENGAD